MRKFSAFVLAIVLVAQPVGVFGRNVVFPPDPVGMKVYQASHLTEIVALSVITFVLLAGCLVHVMRRKPKGTSPESTWFYEI